MAAKPNAHLWRQIVKTHRPNLPVFIVWAYGDANAVATVLARRAAEFLTKPMDFPKLRRNIMVVKADAMRRDA